MFSVTRTFTHETEIHAPPERIMALLSDRVQFARLNPLVLRVEEDAHDPAVFWVYDRLSMVGFTFELKYKAALAVVAEGVDAQAWSTPNVHLYNAWRLTESDGVTRVRETSVITTYSFLMPYVFRTAQQAHVALMQNLKQKIQAQIS